MDSTTHALEVRIAVLEERSRLEGRLLELQGKEYERRLAELNHAHDKQVADQQTYISEDKFAGYVSKTDASIAQIKETLSELAGRAGGRISARESTSQIVTKIILGVGVVVALAVAIWK